MISTALVQNGCTVYISSRKAKECTSKAEELTKMGPGKAVAIPQDLSSEQGVKNLIAKFSELEDRLHILINNSGVTWGAPIEKHPDAAWDKVMAVNLKAVFNMIKYSLPLLDKGSQPNDPARIINIGSTAGVIPQFIPTFAYDCSKISVHHLTRKLSAELARRPTPITVNAIAPGFVPSKMSSQLLHYADKKTFEKAIPLVRFGSPEDMAGAVLYLCGRASAWVTGTVLVVDGGMTSQPVNISIDLPSHL
eukprot:TRINITY_DN548_c0_g1_i2.p1 TRINITY_DN548_c0_g1~~TRINITY_DN548_c0_g1_i2.p1  ORF type:complete len:250 (-),score=80.80 TRINITY_DN548_c0_g1_i2:47-796(-)